MQSFVMTLFGVVLCYIPQGVIFNWMLEGFDKTASFVVWTLFHGFNFCFYSLSPELGV